MNTQKLAEHGWTKIFICHDDVIKWKHFSHYWPFVRGIHQALVDSPHKGQWCWALMFYLICTWTLPGTGGFPSQRPVTLSFLCFLWSAIEQTVEQNNRDAGDLRCHHAHYIVIVMDYVLPLQNGLLPWQPLVRLVSWCHISKSSQLDWSSGTLPLVPDLQM